MINLNVRQGTGTTHCIMKVIKEKRYIGYKYIQSLCDHIGNNKSALNPEYRRELPIKAGDINTTDKPDILNGIKDIRVLNPVQRGRYENVLFSKGEGIGNLINLTPAIIKFKELYPDCNVDILTCGQSVDMLNGWSLIRDIYDANKCYPDVAYDFVVEGIFTSVKYKNYMSTQLVYTGNKTELRTQHEIEANINILKEIDIIIDYIPHTYMYIPGSADITARAYKDKYIGLCIGLGAKHLSKKQWGHINFIKLARLLLKEYPDHKILLLGAGKEDAKIKNIYKIKTKIKNKRLEKWRKKKKWN
ncbi:hypothetical protein LCGC14_2229120 [marine sediment metagenome]|uniref:Uncharacterized protein n=1 Tax=marine sediment metagenome TaxID=412755 RepID=A0A0F9D8W7_9ZZZZ